MGNELKRLRQEIADERKKIDASQKAIAERTELKRLKSKLKVLKSPGRQKFRAGLARTSRGLKFIGKKVSKSVITQAKLIKAQQLRDEAASRKLAKGAKPRQKLSGNPISGFGLDF